MPFVLLATIAAADLALPRSRTIIGLFALVPTIAVPERPSLHVAVHGQGTRHGDKRPGRCGQRCHPSNPSTIAAIIALVH
jgi:hypothetical protein